MDFPFLFFTLPFQSLPRVFCLFSYLYDSTYVFVFVSLPLCLSLSIHTQTFLPFFLSISHTHIPSLSFALSLTLLHRLQVNRKRRSKNAYKRTQTRALCSNMRQDIPLGRSIVEYVVKNST